MTTASEEPWWASGSNEPTDEDPLDAHRRARRAAGEGGSGAAGAAAGPEWLADAAEMVARLASEAGRRLSARMVPDAAAAAGSAADESATQEEPLVGPHADGAVCDACPICIGLRAVQQVRPEVIAHLSDAAHHFSLALRAVAEAQAGDGDVGFTPIDLDP